MIQVYSIDKVDYFIFDSKKIEHISTVITLPSITTEQEFFSFIFSSLSCDKKVCITTEDKKYVDVKSKGYLKNCFAKHSHVEDGFITLSPSIKSKIKKSISSNEISFENCKRIITELARISY